MSVVGYAYPWDFDGDPAAASRAADLGCDVVAVAAAYHAARTVSPLHPTRRVLEVATSASYAPVRPEAWRGRRLAPSPSIEGCGRFEVAASALAAVGVAVAAWVVVTHHDELGAANPDLVVRNAFGDPYTYALCPSSSEVVEYAATLAREVLETTGVASIVLEACGPMGVEHGGVHDKAEFAGWDAVARDLLSVCFCASCAAALADRGVDAAEVARLVRRGVDGGATSVGAALGDALVGELRTVRRSIGATIQGAVLDAAHAARPGVAVTLHGSATPFATGSFPELGEGVSSRLAAVVANAWDPTSAEREIAALAGTIGPDVAVGAYLRLDRGWGDLDDVVARYDAAGATQWHLYHLGLLDGGGLAAGRRVVDAVARRKDPGPRR